MSGLVRVFPVAEGRCPCCGQVPPTWTPEAILQAFKEWARTNGRAPTARDWQRAGAGHPHASWVIKVLGSFAGARELAGLKKPRRVGVTHCRHGHEYTAANTWTDGRGRRVCRRCRADKAREARARLAA